MTPSLPTFGRSRATVRQVGTVSIHGDIYYDVVATLSPTPDTDTGNGIEMPSTHVRLPSHLCRQPPKEGDVLELGFLMGQVNSVTFVPPDGGPEPKR